jgi:serine O-acetyltransferase
MPHLLASIREDVAMVMEHDPAAKSRLEVWLCYSGLHAVWFYRVNHWLWSHGFRLLARWLSQVARLLTGIEIHPGAEIGRGACSSITASGTVIWRNQRSWATTCTLYQGVTLGGTGKENGKRHPTIGKTKSWSAPARKILGNITVGEKLPHWRGIGRAAQTCAPDSTVVGVPGGTSCSATASAW